MRKRKRQKKPPPGALGRKWRRAQLRVYVLRMRVAARPPTLPAARCLLPQLPQLLWCAALAVAADFPAPRSHIVFVVVALRAFLASISGFWKREARREKNVRGKLFFFASAPPPKRSLFRVDCDLDSHLGDAMSLRDPYPPGEAPPGEEEGARGARRGRSRASPSPPKKDDWSRNTEAFLSNIAGGGGAQVKNDYIRIYGAILFRAIWTSHLH